MKLEIQRSTKPRSNTDKLRQTLQYPDKQRVNWDLTESGLLGLFAGIGLETFMIMLEG